MGFETVFLVRMKVKRSRETGFYTLSIAQCPAETMSVAENLSYVITKHAI